MACCSQLRSLMKKNAILWYRHICWSICELLFPIILFAIILIFRIRIKMVDHEQEDYLSLASSATPTPGKPYYNSAQLMIDLPAQNKMLNIFELQFPFLSCSKYKKTVFAFVNADSDNVMTLVKSKLAPYFTLIKNTQDITATTQDFESEEKLEAYVKDLNYGNSASGAMELPTICAAIVRNKSENGNYIYDIRMDDDSRSNKSIIPTTKTKSVNIISKNPNLKTFTNLANSGYTYLQMLIANSVLQTELGNPNAKMQFAYVPMRTNSFLEDTFLSRLKAFMPMFIVLMYIVPIFRMISAVVGEKETKIRESLKMMGLKDSTYWLSWVLYFACIIFVISILVTVICSSKLFKYSNFVTLWLFFFLYGLDVVALSLFIASIFNKSRVASIVGSLIYFGTYFVSLVVSDEGVSSSSKYGSSLLPTVCVSLLTNYLISYESTQTPLTFANMGNVMDNYTYSMGLGMLAIDFVFFILLALYFDNALPKEFGIRKSVCFFFTPSYWRGPKSAEPNLRKISTTDPNKGFKSLYDHPDFEEADNSLRLQEKTKECLRIIELTKKFGEKNAVENLTVTMYKNQIFALLGHNGAGKTTTLSVLTGLIEQTGGFSFIDGVNIMNDRNYFRKILGICPQHNILFEDLTPKEHLKMFAIFKGSSASDQEIDKMIHDIGLDESKNTLAKNLSGGMKRKLSIGIAFIGGSKVILLDEPTSGMDLTARRKVWEMLKNYKSNRVIILTTHYMDEADYLGDRIGIMSGGKLACLGTSFFLKKKFGVGYNLTVVMTKGVDNTGIKNFIKSCIPIAIEKDDGGNDLHYQFNNSDQFPEESVPKFFKELESKKDELGISSYGLSATTLEDVFMNSNVAQRKAEADKAEKTETKVENTDNQVIFELTESRMKNAFCLHLKYGFWKRWKNLSRNLSGLLLILIVPILLMIAGLSLTLIRVYYDSPLIDYGANHFPIPQDVIVNGGSSADLDGFITSSEPDVSFQKYTITSVGQMDQLAEINNYIFDNRAHDPYRYGSVYISNLNKATAQLSAVLFVNISSIDSAAAITQIIERQAIRFFKADLNVTIRNHPLPLTLEARSKEAFKNSNQVSFMYNIAFSIIPAILVSFIVLEKESNLKHQQMISGMSLASYWLSNFLYDIIFNLILASIGIGLLYAFDVDITYSYATILMYEVSIISFSYVSSFIFKSESIAMNVTLGVHMFCGILLGPVFMILRQFEDTQLAADVLVWPLRIIPSFAFADALLSITNVNLFALAYNMTTVPSNLSFRIGGGGSWLFLGIDFVLSWIILILVESRVFIKKPRINEYINY